MSDILWNVLHALLILGAGQIAGTWLGGVARYALGRTGMDPAIRRLAAGVVHPLVLVAALIAALPWIGIDPSSLIAVLGASTLAVGFALRSSLSNLASGAILLTLRPLREGDFVEIAGRTGTLEALELYATTLRTADGTLVTIPNDVVMRAPIVNHTRTPTRRVEVLWQIAPDGKQLPKALEVLRGVVEAHEGVLEDPAPQVLVLGQRPGAIDLAARVHVENAAFGSTRAELLSAGLEALAKARIPLATGRSA